MRGLKVKAISKSSNNVEIVSEVTATFLPGCITALIGPNGAGKTTLFHLITGELQPDHGDIFYKDEKITGLPPYRIARKGIGRLFQDVRIFDNMTVLENVLAACLTPEQESPFFSFFHPAKWHACRKHNLDKALYWLNFVGLQDKRDQSASSLSFGQQKLLAIARLLAGEFNVLLLDEPTAGLNPVMIKKVLDILERIIAEDREKTVVLVEHNMKVVTEMAYWVYFMNEGRIAFFGRTDHVLGDKEVREIYLGL